MAVAIVIAALVLVSIAFQLLTPWWRTPLASNWGSIDTALDITLWVCGFVFVALNLFLAFSIFRYRHRTGHRAHYDPESVALERRLTVWTAVGIAALLAPGLIAWKEYVTVPKDAAVFVKSKEGGDTSSGEMEVGDEYVVRMPGPWDGPVRVVHRAPTSFRFVTLKGHLEAGEIEFRARCEDGELVFEIESWARSGDRVSNLLYNKLLLAKEIQLNLWTETCLGVARNSGGRLRGGVRVHTRRVDDPVAPGGVGPISGRAED